MRAATPQLRDFMIPPRGVHDERTASATAGMAQMNRIRAHPTQVTCSRWPPSTPPVALNRR